MYFVSYGLHLKIPVSAGGKKRNVIPYLPPFRYAVFKDFHSTQS